MDGWRDGWMEVYRDEITNRPDFIMKNRSNFHFRWSLLLQVVFFRTVSKGGVKCAGCLPGSVLLNLGRRGKEKDWAQGEDELMQACGKFIWLSRSLWRKQFFKVILGLGKIAIFSHSLNRPPRISAAGTFLKWLMAGYPLRSLAESGGPCP